MAFKILTGKPTGKRLLGRSTLRWEDNIRMDLEEMGINWVDSGQEKDYWRALVNAKLNLRVPQAMELVNYCYYYASLKPGSKREREILDVVINRKLQKKTNEYQRES